MNDQEFNKFIQELAIKNESYLVEGNVAFIEGAKIAWAKAQDELDGDENCYGCLKREAMNDQLDQENNHLKQQADKLAEALEYYKRQGVFHPYDKVEDISDYGFKAIKALKEYRGDK